MITKNNVFANWFYVRDVFYFRENSDKFSWLFVELIFSRAIFIRFWRSRLWELKKLVSKMKNSLNENQKASSSNNIYDIICYYNEDDDEPKHVTEVIHKIEKTNQRLKRDSWIKWKLVGCLIINVLLSAPVYSYGTLYLLQKPLFDAQPILIWPPIIFMAVSLIVTPWLFNSISTPASRNSRVAANTESSIFTNLTNKNVIIVFSAILSTGVSVAGLAFSYLKANFTMILIFYSIIGGKQVKFKVSKKVI